MAVDGMWVKGAFSRGVWTYEDCTVTPWKRYGLVYRVNEDQSNWFSGSHHGHCATFDEAREIVERYAGAFEESVASAPDRQLKLFDWAGHTMFYNVPLQD
ncbi:MAG: hypothetical protein WC491_05850 [Candidatus Omnitrophota bacterium]|jgi:hypothetical protein